MQVSSTTPYSDVSRQVVEADLMKRQIKKEGAQKQQLIESTLVEQPVKDPKQMIGTVLNVEA